MSSYWSCASCGRFYEAPPHASAAGLPCVTCGSTSLVPAKAEDAQASEATIARLASGSGEGGAALQTSFVGKSLAGGKYVIERFVAEGGGGIVFAAREKARDRMVALKLLKSEGLQEEEVRRFAREARLSTKLHHPNIVETYEIFEDEGRHYMAMEFVEGDTLVGWWNATISALGAASLRGRRDDPSTIQFVRFLIQVLDALGYAHDEGIIHRDLKPQNVLVTPQGAAKLSDFGLARDVSSQSVLTLSGTILGTPNYMSPEQAKGQRDIDRRTDLYGVTAVLYWGLTGKPPFQAPSLLDTLQRILTDEIRSPSSVNPELDRPLEWVLLKGLEKDPGRRYQTASEMRDELSNYLDKGKVRAKPPALLRKAAGKVKRRRSIQITISVAATLLVALGVSAYVLWGIWQRGAYARMREDQRARAQRYLDEARGKPRDEALAILERGLAVGTELPDLRAERARLLLALGRFDDARTEIEAAAHTAHRDPYILYWAGRVEERAGVAFRDESRAERARKRYEEAAALDPADPHAQLGLARVALSRDRTDEALTLIARARERAPDLAETPLLRAEVHLRRSDPGSAEEDLQEARRLDPGNPDASAVEFLLRVQAGDFAGAEESIRRAIEGDRENPLLYWNRAGLYDHLGRAAERDQDLRRVAELDSDGPLGREAGARLPAEPEITPPTPPPGPDPAWQELTELFRHNPAVAEALLSERFNQAMTSGDRAQLLDVAHAALLAQRFEIAERALASLVEGETKDPRACWALGRIQLHRAREQLRRDLRRPILRRAFDLLQAWSAQGKPVLSPDPFPTDPGWRLIETSE